jgi:hypothetical protein
MKDIDLVVDGILGTLDALFFNMEGTAVVGESFDCPELVLGRLYDGFGRTTNSSSNIDSSSICEVQPDATGTGCFLFMLGRAGKNIPIHWQ